MKEKHIRNIALLLFLNITMTGFALSVSAILNIINAKLFDYFVLIVGLITYVYGCVECNKIIKERGK